MVPADFEPEGPVEGPEPALWQRCRSKVRPGAVDPLEEAKRTFYSGVEGCADWNPEGGLTVDFHACRRERLEQISAVLCACYDWAPRRLRRSPSAGSLERELPFLPSPREGNPHGACAPYRQSPRSISVCLASSRHHESRP